MATFIGRKIEVGIGKESTRGTTVVPTYWLKKINADIEDKFETVVDESTMGIIEDATDLKVVKKFAEGEISGYVTDKAIGLFLFGAFGTVASAVKETTAYNHTFSTQQDDQCDTLTVDVNHPNEHLKFGNAIVSGLSFKAEVGKFVEFTAKIMAKMGIASATTPSYTAENNFIAKDATVKIATNAAGLDGASAINSKSAEISIEKEIESDDVLGNVEPLDFLNKKLSITGTVELMYDATTYKALALAGTEQALRLQFSDTSVTIGAASNPTLKIDLNKVKFTEWTKTTDSDNIVRQTLKFKALYSPTDSKMYTVVLTNTATSY
jgi:hypothetical protein